MGCACSRVEREETVQRCRERRRLIKQLVGCRARLALAHLAYLQSLRNTGATLRQLAEADCVAAVPGGDADDAVRLPPPPPRLPPSPPPLPPFSPEPMAEENRGGGAVVGIEGEQEEEIVREDGTDLGDGDEDNIHTPPPPPPHHSSTWDFWEPFTPSSSSCSASPAPRKKEGTTVVTPPAAAEEEDWAETKTEFEEEEDRALEVGADWNPASSLNVVLKQMVRELPSADDNSSAASWFTKDTDMAVVVWRSKKTLAGIVKELDDYFLKASAGGTEVAALLESNRGSFLHRAFEETRGKNCKSAKVFSSLSWRWSSRSPQSVKDLLQRTDDACRSVSHCTTLDKLFAEEQKLYKEVKGEETVKLQLMKKTFLLHKQEAREQDWMETEKTRSSIEELQSQIMSLQESISNTCLSISKLRDEELHPQLIELSSGTMQMWRTMYECHQVQNHIAQQVNHLINLPKNEPTTDSHRHATAQLETEVISWYTAFCSLLRSQREYAHTLNQWIRLTDCIPHIDGSMVSSSGIHTLSEEWQLALDRLPDKVAAEAIKSFVTVVHSIGLQLAEEHNLQKKSERLEKRLEKDLISLSEMEKKYNGTYVEDTVPPPSLNHHPLSVKHAKTDAFRKRVDEEKAKYLNSVRISRVTMLNNLQTSLPNVFQALMGFASVCVQAFEGIHRPYEVTTGHDNGSSPL